MVVDEEAVTPGEGRSRGRMAAGWPEDDCWDAAEVVEVGADGVMVLSGVELTVGGEVSTLLGGDTDEGALLVNILRLDLEFIRVRADAFNWGEI